MSVDVGEALADPRTQRGRAPAAARLLAALCLLGVGVVAETWLLPDPAAHAASPLQVRVAGELDADPGLTAERVAQRPTERASAELTQLATHAMLGEFETRYNRAGAAANRAHNLHTTAQKIAGYVLAPGAVFDFNEIVGGRTPSDGFRHRPLVADGELVDGTCQVASTLHAAVFFAGLPILTRFPLSRPSFYIRLGLDAMVVSGAQNFRFKNDRSYPIVIGLHVDEGRVHASLHGPTHDHSVQFLRNIDTIIPFEERSVLDRSLPAGLHVLRQRGVPGFKITRYRVVTDERTHVSVRERTQDSYPPTAQLWRIGSGREPAADFERPRNDPHPEYVADEHLQMTQTESGSFDVTRDSGRTGSYGWTAREGLLVRKP